MSAALTRELLINGRFLTQQTTGVQAFAKSICEELSTVTNFTILVPGSGNIRDMVCGDRIQPVGMLHGHLWEQISLPRFVSRSRNSFLLNLCNTGPMMLTRQAVTIHDLAFLHNPSWFSYRFAKYYSFLIPRLLNRSKKIFTVSETVKTELLNAFNIDEKKILVINNKVSSVFLTIDPLPPPVPDISPGNYFLMVGTNDPRKNFTMVEKLFRDRFKDVQLVIAGGSHQTFKNNSPEVISKNIRRLGYTPIAHLRWLYQHAIGFINPSLYEGFGIPNLEAFATGCPVVCSDIPVFREVCGNAAFFFQPGDTDQLKEIVQKLLSDKSTAVDHTLNGKVIFTSFQNKNRSHLILKALAE